MFGDLTAIFYFIPLEGEKVNRLLPEKGLHLGRRAGFHNLRTDADRLFPKKPLGLAPGISLSGFRLSGLRDLRV